MKRITYAAAAHDARDIRHHPWIYATDPNDGGHGLMVAHCKPICTEPTACTCEEITHLSHVMLSALYVQAVSVDVVPRDIETWDAENADTFLQIAIYGELIFG